MCFSELSNIFQIVAQIYTYVVFFVVNKKYNIQDIYIVVYGIFENTINSIKAFNCFMSVCLNDFQPIWNIVYFYSVICGPP
jgi:ABC-type polysaccharide/polyol phosphate export permease